MSNFDLELIVKELEKSPMFQLSLSSKELFHSNFLYWIWKSAPNAFKGIIENLIPEKVDWPEGYVVKREYNNYDICVLGINGKRLLILENKVKSIPRFEQLEEYQKENKNSECKYVLLSLSTEFPQKKEIEGNGWHIVNYENLAEVLEKNLHQFTDNYHLSIVKDYISVIEKLHRIAVDLGNSIFDSKWKAPMMIESTDEKQTNPYATLRIHDWHEKLRCSLIITEIIKELPRKGIFWDVKTKDILSNKKYAPFANYFVNSGMTRSQGFFEIKIKLQNDVLFLIQVQGNQYRRGIERIGKLEENRKWLNENRTSISDFFYHSDNLSHPYSDALKICKEDKLEMGLKKKKSEWILPLWRLVFISICRNSRRAARKEFNCCRQRRYK